MAIRLLWAYAALILLGAFGVLVYVRYQDGVSLQSWLPGLGPIGGAIAGVTYALRKKERENSDEE